MQLREELCQLGSQEFIRWVPSHLDPARAEHPMEEWLIHWNSAVDRLAIEAQEDRPPAFLDMFQRYEADLRWWTQQVTQLRHFFFMVASHSAGRTADDSPCALDSEEDTIEVACAAQMHEPLEDHLPINWKQQCALSSLPVPLEFLEV